MASLGGDREPVKSLESLVLSAQTETPKKEQLWSGAFRSLKKKTGKRLHHKNKNTVNHQSIGLRMGPEPVHGGCPYFHYSTSILFYKRVGRITAAGSFRFSCERYIRVDSANATTYQKISAVFCTSKVQQ